MKFIINILILSLIFFGCEKLTYSPTDENYVDVKRPNFYVSIDLMADADTIRGWGNIELQYEVNLSNHQLYQVLCYIDSSLIRTTNNPEMLNFSSNSIEDGYHELILEVWVKSESSSLADKLEAEFVYNQIKKTIYIENSIPEVGINQLSIYPFEGRLKLDWPVYERINFQRYKVFRTYFDENNNRRSVLLGEIKNPFKNWWIDSSYVGGNYEYIVQLEAANEIIPGIYVPVEFEVPTIKSFRSEDEHIRLTWNRTKFYANFEKYSVTRDIFISPWNTFSEYSSIYDVNDTSIVDTTIGFGVGVDYKIMTEPGSVESEITEVYLGEKIPIFSSLQYNEVLNSIYLVYDPNNSNGYGTQTYRLDATSLNIQTNRSGAIMVSDDGTCGFYRTTDKRNLFEVDPVNLTNRGLISINSLFDLENIIYDYSVSNSQVVIIRNENGLALIDLNEMQITHTIPKQIEWPSYHPKIGHVSKNSAHFVAASNPFIGTENNRIYHLSNGTLNYHTMNSYRDYNFCFNSSGDISISTRNNAISVYNSQNYSFLNSIGIQGEALLHPSVDPYFENLIVGQINIVNSGVIEFYIDIYNLSSNQLVKRVRMPLNWRKKRRSNGQNGIYLINKTLFSAHGYYMQLDF